MSDTADGRREGHLTIRVLPQLQRTNAHLEIAIKQMRVCAREEEFPTFPSLGKRITLHP